MLLGLGFALDLALGSLKLALELLPDLSNLGLDLLLCLALSSAHLGPDLGLGRHLWC